MRRELTYFLLLFWQIMPSYIIAQIGNLRFEKVEIQDAPDFSNIDCIYEDSRGFMWFGSYAGLYLFDGYKLTHFKNKPNDPLSISDNKITKILEDSKGNLWVGTQNGINYFDIKNRTFKRFNDKLKDGIGVVGVGSINICTDKKIWVGMLDGLYWSDSTYQKFNKYNLNKPNINVGLKEFSATGIYMITELGLIYKDYNLVSFNIIPLTGVKDFDVDAQIGLLQKDDYGILWIGTNKGLFYINTINNNPTHAIEQPLFKNESIRLMVKKSTNELWIDTKTGLYLFNIKTAKIQKYTYNSLLPNGYPKNKIYNALYSSNNILWTQIYGKKELYTVDINKNQFQNIPIPLMDNIPDVAYLNEMFEYSPDILFVRQKIGTGLLNIATGKISPFFYYPDYNLKGWKGDVTCFFEENGNKLWIGTFGGVFLFDRKTKNFINLETQMKAFHIFREEPIHKIHKDMKGNLWVLTWWNGVFKVDFKNKTIKGYFQTKEEKIRLLGLTRSLLESQKGQIWIGTRGGLCKYMPEADTFKIYGNVLNDSTSMSENTGFTIYEDENENIWVGTYGGGLNKLDIKTGKFKHYTTENGLIDNNVFAILPDKKGNFWLCTFIGISVFNRTTETFQNFNYKNGLFNSGFSAFLYGKGRYSDRFFFGGNDGIDFFYPDSIRLSTVNPHIYITDFKLFNKTVPILRGEKDSKIFYLNEDISFTKHLTLEYQQNVIGFEYAALDYSAPKNIQYAYQLEGFDTSWQYVGNQRSATFTNLNPGNYTFRVKATNGDGAWGTQQASIQIAVLAPWWRTWWFRSLVFLTILGMAYAFYKYRIHQIKERETLKTALNQRIAEVEMEALRSQMSPHFIFNCLSAITRFILNHENEAATLYLTKFSRLVRLVLNHSQMETIPLSKELEAIQLYLEMEALRFHDKFKYALQVDAKLDTHNIHIPPMLIQPYIENAVWHGLLPKKSDDKHLTIDMTTGSESLTITIEDNGIGRQKAAENKSKTALTDEYKSFGMALTEERLGMINKMKIGSAHVQIIDLKNENTEAAGTRVILTIPIQLLPNKKNH